MAGTIKGMTIEIGGNTAPLNQALKDTNRQISSTQKELNEVNKLLKLDPKNTELLAQKQNLLGQQISQTTTKLNALRQAQAQLDAEAKKGGNVNQEEYRKLQREIASAEQKLNGLNNEFKNSGKASKEASQGYTVFKNVLANLATSVIQSAINAVARLGKAFLNTGKEALQSYADYEQLVGGVETLFKENSDTVIANAEKAYKTAGLSANQYMETITSFSASLLQGLGGDTEKATAYADRAIIDMADNANKMGTDISTIQNAYQGFAKQNYTMLDNLKLGYGGTKTEMERLIQDASKMTEVQEKLGITVDASSMSFDNIVNAISVMQDSMGIAGTTAREATETISGSLNALNGAWKNMLTGIADDNANFDELLNNLIDSLMTALKNIMPRVKTIISGLGKLIKEFATTVLPSILPDILQSINDLSAQLIEAIFTSLPAITEALVTSFGNILNKIGELLPTLIPIVINGIVGVADALVNNVDLLINGALQLFLGLVTGLQKALPVLVAKLPEVIQKLVTTLIENLPTIIEAIGTIFVSIANTIGESADTLIPAVISGILAIIDSIIENLPLIIDTIVKVVIAIADALVNNIDKVIEGAVQLIIGLAEGLVQALPKLVERLPEIIMAIVNGLIVLLPKLAEVAWKLIETLASGIIDAVGGLGESLLGIWDYIKTTLGNAFKGIVDVGKNLIEGLWNGIKNAKDWLIGKIKQVCSDALGAIKSFFGIESPSTVMANEVGNYMAEGIGVGFGKTMPSVIKAMQEKLAGVTDAMQTELSFGDIPQIQGNQIISENQYVTRNYTNTVETIRQPQTVELVLDGTKLARTLIQPLDNEYNRLGVKI